jgi:hypothetical protein
VSIKILHAMCVLAVVVAPAYPMAGEQVLDAKALANADVLREYCGKVDPAGADRYRRQAETLAHGASEETLAQLRQGDAYQQARGKITEFLAMVDERNAKKVCAPRPAEKR